MEIAYWSIGWMSTKDGPGNRVVVYMQGCSAQCPWCHSPHSRYNVSPLLFRKQLCRLCKKCEKACPNHAHKFTSDEHFIDYDKCTKCGRCVAACPYSDKGLSSGVLSLPTVIQGVGELFETLRPQLDLVKNSGGITLSGGEALLQNKAALELLKLCKEYQINTCVETSMLLSDSMYQDASQYVDCWLLGFREIFLPQFSDMETARLNCKRLINILRQTTNPRLIARLPIIKGYTDRENQLRVLHDILLENGIMELQILPCNPHMNHYYELIGKEAELNVAQCIPSHEEISDIVEFFLNSGIHTTTIN